MGAAALHFTTALLPEGWRDEVAVDVEDGRIVGVVPGAAPRGERHAIGLPGLPNLHSHTFQRGMAGLAEVAGSGDDSFWTWREVMYRFLDRLTPDDVQAIAALAFVEMLEAGFTSVAEFHYLHHAPDGRPYDDRAELAECVIAAAADSGIGLTMLPSLYTHGDVGGQPPVAGQCRFLHDLDGFVALVEELRRRHPDVVVGTAPHSLRAVTSDQLAALMAAVPDGPTHIHVAEQEREVEACAATLGARPVAWLMDQLPVDDRWCLIHATHTTDEEIAAIARSGAVVGACPITEASLGDGILPATALLAAGGRLGVGSDSNVRIDAAGELRQLEDGQRLRDRRRNRLAAPGASVGGTLYRWALAGGAQALGQPVGKLEVGRRADIVTLDPHHPSLVGRRGDAILDALVFACAERPIDRVIVGGRTLVEGGRHRDRERARQAFVRTIARLAD